MSLERLTENQPTRFRWAVLLCLVLSCGACESFKIKKTELPAKSPNLLQPNEMQENTVGIEIFMIRVTPQQQSLLKQLWHEVDEQMIPAVQRHHLREHGIRIGIQGSYLSSTLSQLLNVTSQRQQGEGIGPDGMEEVSVSGARLDPTVSRQFRNLLPGMRAVLQPFDDSVGEVSLFWREEGRICGKTYKDALGMIALTAKSQANGSVRFEVVPELEYGVSEMRIRSHHGVFIQESGKPKRIFETLAVNLDILPGQWIILGASDTNCSGVGRDLFLRGEEKNDQKVVAIRLLHMKKEAPTGTGRPTAPTIPERR